MKFSSIKLFKWKQFGIIDLVFHPKLTILTGANGSGKTTILNLLGQHFGWNSPQMATPAYDKEVGRYRFFAQFYKTPIIAKGNIIGEIVYDNQIKGTLSVPENDSGATYNVNILEQQPVKGFMINSHRPPYSYRQVEQLAIRKRNKNEAFSLVISSSFDRIYGNGNNRHPSNYYIKETLITWGIFGFGNEVVEGDREQINFYKGFEEVLKKMLPATLGFRRFSIRNNAEVVLETNTGHFMLDSVSGGISTIIDLAWQIYTYSTKENGEFTVLIDEVENHLHASMQRNLLPDLLKAFPEVQFIVSTHSPLIVGSVKDSNVYALQYSNNKVWSAKLDLVNKAKTATEMLRDVLGVPFTMPIWVEEKMNNITNKYSNVEINQNTLNNIRLELGEVGLESLVPDTISKVVETKRKNGKT